MRHDSAKLGDASSVCAASSDAPAARRSNTPRFGSLQAPREHDEHERREGEDDERPAPAPFRGDEAGGERSDDRADRVRRAMERVHAGPDGDVVVVGDQRVVRRVDHCLADARAGTGDSEHDDRPSQTGEHAEERPGKGADPGDADAVVAVGVRGDRHLQHEGDERHRRRLRPSRPVRFRPNSSRMFGSSTANAVRSSSSTAFRPNSTSNGKTAAPPVIPSSHFLTLSSLRLRDLHQSIAPLGTASSSGVSSASRCGRGLGPRRVNEVARPGASTWWSRATLASQRSRRR